MRLVLQLALLTTLSLGCATAPSVLPERPDARPVLDTAARLPTKRLHLTSGAVTYHFSQSSNIRPEGGNDTSYTTIATEALFSVVITPLGDSTYEISISADSVRVTPSGSAPTLSRGIERSPVSLGILLRASLGPMAKSIKVLLPDSLCAYGQLISSAQEIALLSLPYAASLTESHSWRDSSRFSTCRAGAIVETLAFHEVTYSPSKPNELALKTDATILGSGTLRTDSIVVSGTVMSLGRAILEGVNRLPVKMHTESQGLIRVRLADSTTVFRQQSVQEWHQRKPN